MGIIAKCASPHDLRIAHIGLHLTSPTLALANASDILLLVRGLPDHLFALAVNNPSEQSWQILREWYRSHCAFCGVEGEFRFRHQRTDAGPDRECPDCRYQRILTDRFNKRHKILKEKEASRYWMTHKSRGNWFRSRHPDWSEADIAQFLYWEGELSCQQEGKSLLRKIRQFLKPSRRA